MPPKSLLLRTEVLFRAFTLSRFSREVTRTIVGHHRLWRQFLLVMALACVATAQPASRAKTLVSQGNLDGMRWPNFSDYRSWLQKFNLNRL